MARDGRSRSIASRFLHRARAPLGVEPVLEPAQHRVLVASIAYGLGFSLALWVLDAAVDGFLLPDVGFVANLLHPPKSDVWMRLLLTGVCLVFSVLYFRARAAERRSRVFAGAVEHAPDGIQIVGLDGRIVYSNQAVETIYGITRAGWRGRLVGELNVDPAFAQREIFPALVSRGEWQGEIEVRHQDGHTFPIWLTTTLIRDEGGRPLSFVGIIRDMTERRADAEALVHYASELEGANDLKELFADIMRHDLANPASAIRMSSEMLLARELDPQARRQLRAIHRSAGRVIELCEGAASYAKLTSIAEVEFADLDLADLLRDTMREFELPAAEKKLGLSLQAPARCRARVSPIVVEVFANLVSNAVKYSPSDAAVEVAITDEPEAWLVEVRDRGEGVRDGDKERLFSRFERLEKAGIKGTGLGLAIAKRIVDLHNGSIWVEDNAGGGSVFKVRLPKLEREGRAAAVRRAEARTASEHALPSDQPSR